MNKNQNQICVSFIIFSISFFVLSLDNSLARPLTNREVVSSSLDEIDKGVSSEMKSRGNNSYLNDSKMKVDENLNVISSLEVVSMDITSVMDIISSKSNLVILYKDDVDGKVSLSLHDVNAIDIIQIIALENNLAYSQNEGMIHVLTEKEFEKSFGYSFKHGIKVRRVKLNNSEPGIMIDALSKIKSSEGKIIFSKKSNELILMDYVSALKEMEVYIESNDLLQVTKIFKLEYTDIKDIIKKIEGVISENLGSMKYDDVNKSIVVTDYENKIRKIENIINLAEKNSIDILMDINIIQIMLNDEYEMGVDWEAIVSNFKQTKFSGFYDDENNKLKLGTVSDEDYEVLLEALDTVGIINTLSNKKRSTNNLKKVDVTVKVRDISSLDERDLSASFDKNEELVFDLTPNILDGGEISIVVDADGISYGDELLDSKDDLLLNLNEGATLVIGGIFKDITVESLRKIPLLGDLPLLGFAFRNHGQRVRKTEIIVFITPTLASGNTINSN